MECQPANNNDTMPLDYFAAVAAATTTTVDGVDDGDDDDIKEINQNTVLIKQQMVRGHRAHKCAFDVRIYVCKLCEHNSF